MQQILDHVKGLRLGDMRAYKNLVVTPILGNEGPLDHIVLADALNSGFQITEKGGATVPTLFAMNRTGKNVLAITGEYVVGGKQNRTLIRNVIFDKGFEGDLPVRCVQQGRWDSGRERPRRSRPIGPDIEMPEIPDGEYGPLEHAEPTVGPGVFRHAGHSPVSASLRARNQGETWEGVSNLMCAMGVDSFTGDLNEVYEKSGEELGKYTENFRLVDGQVGNLAVIGKPSQRIFVVDLFDRSGVLGKHYDNLVNSYALEARASGEPKFEIDQAELEGFLRSVDSARFTEQRPVSVGKDFKLSGNNLEGSCLVYGGNLAYMSLISRAKGNQGSEAVPGHHVFEPRQGGGQSGSVDGGFLSGFYRSLG